MQNFFSIYIRRTAIPPWPSGSSRQVNRMKEELDLFNFGVVVCDECHYLKNQRAARTRVCV